MHRVAMISYHTCPLAVLGGKDTGGMNVYVRELTRTLGEAGVHVDIFTRSQDEHVPHVLHDLGYGNRVVHIPAGPEHPLPKQDLARFLPEFVDGIVRFSRDKGIQYDMVHSHYWMSALAGADLKKSWGVPMVTMFHTLGLMKNRVARSESEMEGAYRVQGEMQAIQASDRVIAATLAERAQLELLYHMDARKIVIIPPGVDTSRFYPISPDEAKIVVGIPAQDRMVLFVGRIEPLKGIDTLIQAMALVRQDCERDLCPHYLVIIGGDPDASPERMTFEMARLKQLCAELNLGELVVFLGKRGQDTLPYYYSAAEVLVMPSHYESFGMVALEAMACGTPVVASQVGGLAFLVKDGETGFLVPDDDPQILSERLRALMRDSDLRRRMGAQASALAVGYAWHNITGRVRVLYDQLTGLTQPGQAPPEPDWLGIA